MSKTIESLRINPTKDALLHGAIADTYFHKKPRKQKNPVRIPQPPKVIPLALIASAIGALIVAAIISIALDGYADHLRRKIAASKIIPIFVDGTFGKDIVKKMDFRGSARNKSEIVEKVLLLRNMDKYGWADMALDLRFPVDLTYRDMVISFKGKIGGEKLSLVLRDTSNKSAVASDIYLTSGWRTERIPLDTLKNTIDLTCVSQIRLEFSFSGEPPADAQALRGNSTAYIREMRIAKKETRI